MSIVFWLVATLFCLKIGWNFLTPYVMAVQLFRTDATKTNSVSLAIAVEFLLWVIALVVSTIASDATWLLRPKQVALYGVALIIASYVHFILASVTAGWLASKLKRSKQMRQEESRRGNS